VLLVARAWLELLAPGDRIRFVDARGARRALSVTESRATGCWTETRKTCYIVPGTLLRRAKGERATGLVETSVGALPGKRGVLHLQTGDLLEVTRNDATGRPAVLNSAGRQMRAAVIGCTLPQALDDVRPGEAIMFDDGKIVGQIEQLTPDHALVRITRTAPDGGKLRADMGINLPDSALSLDAITGLDDEALSFAARYADVIELSFANTVHDVTQLQDALERLGQRRPGIVLKIETRRGFENLPEMLLAAMRWPSCGVMIARGDLAVECGFERLAEVQEEILWISEAAHVPVIWATQVLENLAKFGMPSRAEITDAAMGHRAECVMLNKGPHIVDAVRLLDDILRRMEAHQAKKRAMLRELHLARWRPPLAAAAEDVRGQH